MAARVFISHRPHDAAGATALAGELDAMFGDGQIVRLAGDAASAARWRDALGGGPGEPPILLALVTAAAPAAAGAPAADDTGLRAELDAGLAAGLVVLPLLGDGVAGLASEGELPTPFRRLSHLARLPMRQAEWPRDVAGLGETLRGLGVRPLATTLPGTMPLPLHDEGPSTTPMAPEEELLPADEAGADGGRRGLLGMVAVGALLVGGWGLWRWRQRKAADLSGIWHGRIGLSGAPTSREGGQMLFSLTQKGNNVGLSSTVGIENDPQWEAVRDAWKERTGGDLRQVIYRGEGEFIDEGEGATRPASEPAAASDAASAGSAKGDTDPARRIVDPTVGMRRVVINVRIAALGTTSATGEKLDDGLFRGIVDLGDQRIHGRLWLESEQAERVVDLRRGD